MGNELALEYIIRRKQKSLSFINIKCRTKFCRDTLMGQQRGKKRTKNTLSYSGMEYIHDDI